ncbi:MAG: hypothetical protein JOY61_12765 [Chloroflexi bacterium]|nr:hypothetical protein [Chloroflexota bacterium]
MADIVRTLGVGPRGRFSAERERQFTEQQLVDITTPFLDALLESFDDLDDVANGEIAPRDLRERSLLGSATMIRALAGAWYELKEEHSFSDDQVGRYFSGIQSVTDSPLPKDSPWLLDDWSPASTRALRVTRHRTCIVASTRT